MEIRRTEPDDAQAFVEVLSAAFGHRPSADHVAEDVADVAGIRGWVALAEGRPVGVGGLIDVRLTLPGGGRLPIAGVTEVGVLPTHRRRGVLRRLMAALLDDAREGGAASAGLMASEAPIYGRFGFGAADRVARVAVETGDVSLREPLSRYRPAWRSPTWRPPGRSCPISTRGSAPRATGWSSLPAFRLPPPVPGRRP